MSETVIIFFFRLKGSDICDRSVNFDADYSLTSKERAECMAFKRLLLDKLAPAADFYFWVDAVNAKEFSLPWYGKHLGRHSMELWRRSPIFIGSSQVEMA